MSRRCGAGSTANRIAPPPSGNRSSSSIRATCWPSAWRISSTSGSAGRRHAGLGARRRAALERRAAGLRRHPRLPLLRARGMRPLHRGGGRPARRRSSAIPATCGRRMASRMCWRCRAGAARASPGSTPAAQLGGRQQPQAPSLVARRDVPSGARRRWTRCWRCTTSGSATSARR